MRKPTNPDEEEAYYLPELPASPDDDPYIFDVVPPEFTALPFTLDD